MSLAEDLRRPFDSNARRGAPVLATPRKALSEVPSRPEPVMSMAPMNEARLEQPAPAPGVAKESIDLLDRASRGVVFILTRYTQLEEHVKQLDAWSKAQINAAEAAAARWEETAIAAEAQIAELQRTLDEVTRQAQVSELAMQRDKAALTVLQDRIIASFGFGSEVHDAIQSVGLD